MPSIGQQEVGCPSRLGERSLPQGRWRRGIPGATRVIVLRDVCYLALSVVNQICGALLTPAFSIAAFSSADAANALAMSRL